MHMTILKGDFNLRWSGDIDLLTVRMWLENVSSRFRKNTTLRLGLSWENACEMLPEEFVVLMSLANMLPFAT